jgi:hypothetical protein
MAVEMTAIAKGEYPGFVTLPRFVDLVLQGIRGQIRLLSDIQHHRSQAENGRTKIGHRSWITGSDCRNRIVTSTGV